MHLVTHSQVAALCPAPSWAQHTESRLQSHIWFRVSLERSIYGRLGTLHVGSSGDRAGQNRWVVTTAEPGAQWKELVTGVGGSGRGLWWPGWREPTDLFPAVCFTGHSGVWVLAQLSLTDGLLHHQCKLGCCSNHWSLSTLSFLSMAVLWIETWAFTLSCIPRVF